MAITDFLENAIQGEENSKDLFQEASKYIYHVLCNKVEAKENFEAILDLYFKQLSFFADDYYDLKNMLYFLLTTNPKKYGDKNTKKFRKLAEVNISLNINKWVNKINLEDLSQKEAILLSHFQK